MTNQHLTEEQFTDALTGDCDVAVSHHLHSCRECRHEAQQVREAISDFAAASLEWAEQCSRRPIAVRPRFVPRWQAATSCAATVVLGIAVLFGMHQAKIQTSARVAVPAASPVDVAEDNRLLAAIDTEIRWQAQSPVAIGTPACRSCSHSPRKSSN